MRQTNVLDDATYNDDATNGATYVAPTLRWSGALAAGRTVKVGAGAAFLVIRRRRTAE